MDVFLMVRRRKTTLFLDAKETSSVLELKRMIEGIVRVAPHKQRLYAPNNRVMEDAQSLAACGLTAANAKAQAPAEIGLAFMDDESGRWESVEKTPYSIPPELPDVMKPPSDGAADNVAPASNGQGANTNIN